MQYNVDTMENLYVQFFLFLPIPNSLVPYVLYPELRVNVSAYASEFSTAGIETETSHGFFVHYWFRWVPNHRKSQKKNIYKKPLVLARNRIRATWLVIRNLPSLPLCSLLKSIWIAFCNIFLKITSQILFFVYCILTITLLSFSVFQGRVHKFIPFERNRQTTVGWTSRICSGKCVSKAVAKV